MLYRVPPLMKKRSMFMNNLQIFTNPEFGEVRTVCINNEPWFVGKDVAIILKYANPNEAINDHVDAEDKLNSKTLTSFPLDLGQRGGWLINESGLYSLILSSKLPAAKKFKRWVTREVLPSIHKHGVYAIDELLNNPDFAIKALCELRDERKKRKALEAENAAQKQAIADFQPIQQYVDKILSSSGTMATSQIAADYEMSARRLNRILFENGIQHRVNGQWILYKKYMGKGYTSSKTVDITRSDGSAATILHTVWTQKGRLLIHNILEKRGIQAVMDREHVRM